MRAPLSAVHEAGVLQRHHALTRAELMRRIAEGRDIKQVAAIVNADAVAVAGELVATHQHLYMIAC